MKIRCYACENEGNSTEHSPPQCIFPEAKDTPGKNFRKNMITVPACDEHNLCKSKDDEYLMMILVTHFENNEAAYDQMKTKIIRAWQRRPHLAKMAIQKPRLARLNGQETLTFEVDRERFDRSMELIARAVTFHDHKFKWPSKGVVWCTGMLPNQDQNSDKILAAINLLRQAMPQIFKDIPFIGENKEIFKYRIHLPKQPEGLGLV